jgi:3-dehydroquinate synthase
MTTRTLAVPLPGRDYLIHIGTGLLAHARDVLGDAAAGRVVIVSNAIVAAHHLPALRRSLGHGSDAPEAILVPDGEAHKDWSTLQDVITRLLELRVDRGTTLIALGGGVVGDLAGFAAAIYQRGIAFVQVPTTLLAQVDSSVGGKTGINHPLGKNMVGAFHQPAAVLIDTDCLRTLPDRELAAGLAEVVKYGAIRDAAFFAWLEENAAALRARDAEALVHAIHESCRIKAEVVVADERETGERALLNFGHTFGHAIETATGYGTWLHGEAVGAGMILAARLSHRVLHLDAAHVERLDALLRALDVPVDPPRLALPRWLELMGRDKKALGGRLRFILLEAIGRARIVSDVPQGELAAVLA